jgi:hypothetical protein
LEDVKITENGLRVSRKLNDYGAYSRNVLKIHKLLLSDYPKPMTIMEISKKVKLSRPTVAKHLKTLRSEKKAMRVMVLGKEKEILWVAWLPSEPKYFPPGYCILPAWEIEKLEHKEDVDIFVRRYHE